MAMPWHCHGNAMAGTSLVTPTSTPIAVFLKNALSQNFEHVNSQIGQNWSDLVRFGHQIIKYHQISSNIYSF